MSIIAPGRSLRLAGALLLGGLLCLAMIGLPATAAKQVILQVSGKVETSNGSRALSFDVAELEGIGIARVQTSTPWTDGRPVFEGVLISDLLKAVGAEGETIVAIALNDYRVEIPMSDFMKFPVLLAYKMDGERLQVRDKGPLWIVYPQDDFPELKTKQVQSRWVWQLRELAIR